jgi:type VI protein secretion system component Hcp
MGTDSHDTSRRTILKGSALGAGALLGAAALPATARAATPAKQPAVPGNPGSDSYFLKIKSGSIPLTSFSFGASRAASGGRTTAKEGTAGQLHFTAPTTIASPTLLLHSLEGTPIGNGTLTVIDEGTGAEYVKIDLTDIILSSYEISAASDEIPSGVGSLSYFKVIFSYYPFDAASGALGTPTTIRWDTRTDKAF